MPALVSTQRIAALSKGVPANRLRNKAGSIQLTNKVGSLFLTKKGS